MTDLDQMIRDFARQAPTAGDPAEQAAADHTRERLRAAIATERTGPHWRRTRAALQPRRFALAGAGACAVAAGLLVLDAALPGIGSHEGPVTLPSLGPSSSAAAIVLDRAAAIAALQPQAPYASAHQYAYSKTLQGSTGIIGQSSGPPAHLKPGQSFTPTCWGNVAFSYTFTDEQWVAPSGSGRDRVVRGASVFLTPRDRAVAQRYHESTAGIEPSMDTRYLRGMFPYSSPKGLPDQPRALLRAIVVRYERGRYDRWTTFYRAEELLAASNSPRLRASIFLMLAQLPGVEVLARRTDHLGRTGTAVAVPEGDGVSGVLVFDPRSSKLLETADIQTSPATHSTHGGCTPRNHVGWVINFTDYLTTGIVNSITERPDRRTVPFHPHG